MIQRGGERGRMGRRNGEMVDVCGGEEIEEGEGKF